MAGFQQAALKIEREQEFQQLKDAIDRALSPEKVEKFLDRMKGRGSRVRNFDAVLAGGVLESVGVLGTEKNGASSLYQSLSVSDQAQIREFYLFRVEEVAPALRTRFQKLYQYY